MERSQGRIFLRSILGYAFLALLLPATSFATRFDTSETSSVRSLGMGNAGINSERGGISTFYNPANIAAKSTTTDFQLLNVSLETNEGLAAQSQSGSINYRDIGRFYQSLAANQGNFMNARYSLFPNFTVRNFSLGLLYEQNSGGVVLPADGSLMLKARDRFGPVASLSFRLFKGIFRIGANVQYLTVGYANSTIESPATKNLSWRNYINSKAGITKSGGITLTLPFRYLPSFSVVARDVGGTTFGKPPLLPTGDGVNVPARAMTIDGAFGYTVYLAKRLDSKFEIDYRDVNNKLAGNSMLHIFAGSEFIFFDTVSLRAGLMNGYPTGGFGLITRKTNINLAWYSEELSDRYHGWRDQRYVLQFSTNMFTGTRR